MLLLFLGLCFLSKLKCLLKPKIQNIKGFARLYVPDGIWKATFPHCITAVPPRLYLIKLHSTSENWDLLSTACYTVFSQCASALRRSPLPETLFTLSILLFLWTKKEMRLSEHHSHTHINRLGVTETSVFWKRNIKNLTWPSTIGTMIEIVWWSNETKTFWSWIQPCLFKKLTLKQGKVLKPTVKHGWCFETSIL